MELGRAVLVTNVADFEDIEVSQDATVMVATEAVAMVASRETVTV